MTDLIENAKNTRPIRKRKTKTRVPDAHVQELAVAWSRGEITYSDFIRALDVKYGYVYLALALRDHLIKLNK